MQNFVDNYASIGRRALAFFIDALILLPACAVGGRIIPVLGAVIVLFFYAPLLESSELRATVGKYLVGIQVADLQGRRISLRAALVRNLLKFISVGIMFLGFIFALFTARKQALHDLLADTIVVYGRSDRPVADAWKDAAKDVFNRVSTAGSTNTDDMSVVAQLERLQKLREQGALTEDEFQEQKKKILG